MLKLNRADWRQCAVVNYSITLHSNNAECLRISFAYFEVAETIEKVHVETRAKAIKDTNTFITCVACMRFRHKQKKKNKYIYK